jgi:lipopolysaccharide export system protein LptA
MQIGTRLAVALVCMLAARTASAQNFGAAFAGFNSDSNTPIQIEADRLEVHDADKLAIYSGHVRVLQGETLLEAPELRVFYRGEATTNSGATAAGTTVAGSQVSRIEAGPGVTVHTGDQVASADRAVFNVAQDLVTMTGNVLLTQGDNVVHGERLVVNLATKEGRVEGGRVQTLITPSSGTPGKNGAPGTK